MEIGGETSLHITNLYEEVCSDEANLHGSQEYCDKGENSDKECQQQSSTTIEKLHTKSTFT